MFADALLDRRIRSRRGWATLTSFGLQALVVTCLLVLPLFYPQGIPQLVSAVRVLTVPQGPESVPQTEPRVQRGGPAPLSNRQGPVFQMPREIPRGVSNAPDSGAPTIPTIGVGGPGPNGPGPIDSVIRSIGNGPPPFIAQPPQPGVIRVSRIMEGSLLHRIEPQYPPPAKMAGIQGAVVLSAVIGRDGTVQNLQVLSGHPFLVRAAVSAVREWRYRPYILNGTPVEVETRITVNFILSR